METNERIEVDNAIIESTSITIADHGCLSVWLTLNYGEFGVQGFGGYSLYLPKSFKHSTNQKNYAGHFIYRILEIAGVEEWNGLVGKTIRVKHSRSAIYEIGHIVKNDWFNPKIDFEKMEKDNDGK